MLIMRARTKNLRVGAIALTLVACEPEAPPRPDASAPAHAETGPPPTFQPGTTAAILTFAGDRGTFKDGKSVEDVPEASRGMVRVSLLAGPSAPPGMVWVANLKEAGTEAVALHTVPRDRFEELALGLGLSSAVTLPEGLEAPAQLGAPSGGVVVYKTAWCGVCKKVQGYLDRKGVPYEAKDIEQDMAAAAELQAKANRAGIKTGSVPVIDVGGELLVGFNRARLEKLLAR